MNWKEFLKPDVMKIILAIGIFIILAYFLFYIPSKTVIFTPQYFAARALNLKAACCSDVLASRPLQNFCTIVTNSTGFVFTVDNCNKYFSDEQKAQREAEQIAIIIFWLEFVFAIIFSYLLSCLILWIFRRTRGDPE